MSSCHSKLKTQNSPVAPRRQKTNYTRIHGTDSRKVGCASSQSIKTVAPRLLAWIQRTRQRISFHLPGDWRLEMSDEDVDLRCIDNHNLHAILTSHPLPMGRGCEWRKPMTNHTDLPE